MAPPRTLSTQPSFNWPQSTTHSLQVMTSRVAKPVSRPWWATSSSVLVFVSLQSFLTITWATTTARICLKTSASSPRKSQRAVYSMMLSRVTRLSTQLAATRLTTKSSLSMYHSLVTQSARSTSTLLKSSWMVPTPSVPTTFARTHFLPFLSCTTWLSSPICFREWRLTALRWAQSFHISRSSSRRQLPIMASTWSTVSLDREKLLLTCWRSLQVSCQTIPPSSPSSSERQLYLLNIERKTKCWMKLKVLNSNYFQISVAICPGIFCA